MSCKIKLAIARLNNIKLPITRLNKVKPATQRFTEFRGGNPHSPWKKKTAVNKNHCPPKLMVVIRQFVVSGGREIVPFPEDKTPPMSVTSHC